MSYVVLTRAPTFELEGTSHRVCSDPVEAGIVQTVCGLSLENTRETATVILTARPRGKATPLCGKCKR